MTEPSTPPPSPLTADKPDSIDELFRREYTTWDDQDVETMIATLRAHRIKLGNLDEKPKAAAKQPKVDVTGITDPTDLLKAIGLGGPL